MNIQLAVEYLDHEVFYITPSTIIDIWEMSRFSTRFRNTCT